MKLVVVRPFGGFARGDVITAEDRVTAILQGENALNVVRVTESTAPAQKGG